MWDMHFPEWPDYILICPSMSILYEVPKESDRRKGETREAVVSRGIITGRRWMLTTRSA